MTGALQAGDVLAGCRIERSIGHGGMGTVYLAEQIELERRVALKVINPALADDPSFAQRFRAETRVAARVEHPNVVPLYEAGEDRGMLYMLMRFVAGSDLGHVLAAEGAQDPLRAAELVGHVAAGLDAVHAAGLVHRDLKPGNVLIGSDSGYEHVYLTDFGLAKQAASTSGPTSAGAVVGTLNYIAPEQVSGKAVDARADVYALGCLLFQLLTGEVPFPREDAAATMWAQMHEQPPRPSHRGGPGLCDMDPVITRALAKDPEDRYPSAGDLGRAVFAAATGKTVVRPERSVASGAAAPTGPPVPPPPPPPPDSDPRASQPTVTPVSVLEPTRTDADAHAPEADSSGRRPPLPLLGGALAAVVAVAVALLLLTGGGEEGNGTQPPPTPNPTDGPAGELRQDGVGDVVAGATTQEVEDAWGEPERQDTGSVVGIETRFRIWTYEFSKATNDSLSVYFDLDGGTMVGYSTQSDELQTEEGVTVGDSEDELRAAYGDRLDPLPAAPEQMPIYWVSDSGTPAGGDGVANAFNLNGGAIYRIAGGDPPP